MGQNALKGFADRAAVGVPGWDQPMIPITPEERDAILNTWEAFKSKEAMRTAVNKLAPPGQFEAFQKPLLAAIDILSRTGGPDRAIYSAVRIVTAYAIANCGSGDWRSKRLSSLMAELEEFCDPLAPWSQYEYGSTRSD